MKFSLMNFLGALFGHLTVMTICVGGMTLFPGGPTLLQAWVFYSFMVGVGLPIHQAIQAGRGK